MERLWAVIINDKHRFCPLCWTLYCLGDPKLGQKRIVPTKRDREQHRHPVDKSEKPPHVTF